MPPALRLVAYLRPLWPVAAGAASCLAAGPLLLGLATPGRLGQAAVCAGTFLQILVGTAVAAGRGNTDSLVAPYVAAWVPLLAGFALQVPGWLR